ncbi:MAG: putative alanine--tRNA ligase, partial [Streblomastix strix]
MEGIGYEFSKETRTSNIILYEYRRWKTTDSEAEDRIRAVQKNRAKENNKEKLKGKEAEKEKIKEKGKNEKQDKNKEKEKPEKTEKTEKSGKDAESDVNKTVLSIDDWIMLCTTYGVMADQISKTTGQEIPDSFYKNLEETKEKQVRVQQGGKNAYTQICQELPIPETEELIYSRRDNTEITQLMSQPVQLPPDFHPKELPMNLDDLTFKTTALAALESEIEENEEIGLKDEDQQEEQKEFQKDKIKEKQNQNQKEKQKEKKKVFDVVVLTETLFYPTSGGQDHDTGKLEFVWPDQTKSSHKVYDVLKCSKCVAHRFTPPLTTEQAQLINKQIEFWEKSKKQLENQGEIQKDAENEGLIVEVHGEVDRERRYQLACHHTATHLVHAAAHKILGTHVWQSSAKKTIKGAHLDITHYQAITPQERKDIENL